MANILNALKNIFKTPRRELLNHYKSRNTINNMGEALEEYIKDAFANTINEKDLYTKKIRQSEIFSYLGNKNNPPDAIIRNGDAIEVKKVEKYWTKTIALNSSYPKHKLHYDDPRLTKACRNSEKWNEKDIIYVVGTVEKENDKLKNLWFVYGDCYAASRETYEKMFLTIEKGITSIPNIEFSPTKELGKVKRVDPLGITELRIRGMWQIESPSYVFKDIYTPENNVDGLHIACLMREEKYNSFDEKSKNALNNMDFKIERVKISDPDNPATLLDAILIKAVCKGA